MDKKYFGALCSALITLAAPAHATPDVDLHGFFTVGYSRSNVKFGFLNTIDETGDFSATSNAGLQVAANPSDRLLLQLQAVARGRPDQNFHLDLDLAQARYLLTPSHDVIMGRIRIPLFMISDYRMVGALYPWTLPPVEIYEVLPLEAVGANETLIGANFITRADLGGGWNLENEIFGGGSSRAIEPPNRRIDAVSKRIFGSELAFTKDELLLRASYMNALNKSTTREALAGSQPTEQDTSLGTIQFLTAGMRWEPSNWLILGEFAHIFAESRRFEEVYSHYETLGYRFFGRRLLTHLTYGGILNASQTSENLGQHSFTAGLNYAPVDSLVFKVELQRIFPNAPAPPPPPPGPPGGAAPPRQGGPGQGSGMFSSQPDTPLTVLYLSINAVF